MSISEMARALGIDKAVVSRHARRGMPMHSTQAANAWREVNAKPRARKGQPLPPPAALTLTAATAAPAELDAEAEAGNSPKDSLQRARLAEVNGYRQLMACQEAGGSLDELKKANGIYIAARNNRHRAERDFLEWQRQEKIILFLDEAQEIAARPHRAARPMLESMPKTLAPRLYGQPQKAIEKTLADWADALAAVIRESF
jgi:hypothetical protein